MRRQCRYKDVSYFRTKHTLVRSKATEGVFTRHSCSFRCVKPSNRDNEDAGDADYDEMTRAEHIHSTY